eukprot:366157-Chlamydomonas_euryale.AAC.28
MVVFRATRVRLHARKMHLRCMINNPGHACSTECTVQRGRVRTCAVRLKQRQLLRHVREHAQLDLRVVGRQERPAGCRGEGAPDAALHACCGAVG